jgi:hypothetical protein
MRIPKTATYSYTLNNFWGETYGQTSLCVNFTRTKLVSRDLGLFISTQNFTHGQTIDLNLVCSQTASCWLLSGLPYNPGDEKKIGSSEMAVNFYRATWRHIQDDNPLKTNVLSGSKDITRSYQNYKNVVLM